MTLKLHTQTSFSREIERLVREKKLSYFEALCEYCASIEIDPESVPKLINKTIKARIEEEAADLNMIHRGRKRGKLKLE